MQNKNIPQNPICAHSVKLEKQVTFQCKYFRLQQLSSNLHKITDYLNLYYTVWKKSPSEKFSRLNFPHRPFLERALVT